MSPLQYGTVRAHMAHQLHLAGSVGAELYGGNDQWDALMRGADVVLTREQLSMFSHPSIPANLQDHALWTLSGEDTLTPVV
jgi:hypothetical protein